MIAGLLVAVAVVLTIILLTGSPATHRSTSPQSQSGRALGLQHR